MLFKTFFELWGISEALEVIRDNNHSKRLLKNNESSINQIKSLFLILQTSKGHFGDKLWRLVD